MMAWSRTKLAKELKQAGWAKRDGNATSFTSPDGEREFYFDQYRADTGILWRYFAEREQLPGETFRTFNGL
jgi:hypothetical protein